MVAADPGHDDLLLAAANAGDREAQAALLERHYGLLRAIAGRILGWSSPDLEDAVQDAVVRALGSWAKSAPRNARAWLAKIAVNTCIGIIRKRKPMALWSSLDGEPHRHNVLRSGEDPTGTVAERADLLATCLERLLVQNPRQRAAIELTYVVDLPQKDVADALDITHESLRQHLTRARRMLADCLTQEGASDG